MIGALLVIAQLSIVAHGPDSASTCEAVELSVAVSAPGRVAPQIVVPSLAPFDVLRSSAVPHVSYDQSAMIAEYRYVITTDRTGTFTIPAFEARLGANVTRSRPIQLTVRQASGRTPLPTVVARARVDTSLEVNFHALTLPETVFVGQQANYEVAVFLNATVRDRLRRNPTFFPPDMQSMLAYDLPARADPPRRQVGSHCFDALVYQRALFPLMPGRFAIPPAQLVYSLPLSASFFSREETHELQTDSTVIVAVDPPSLGRPLDYGGAVGSLHVAAKLDTAGSRVGDPLLLTVKVSGTGNVKLFPRPAVGIAWGTLVKGDERVQVDTTAKKIGGSKEFDWLLTPRVAGELDVPPIRYSYFNPDSRRYEVAQTSSTHLRVGDGSLASADTARSEALLSLRTRYRGAPRTPLHQHPIFWAILALMPVPALSLGTRERRRRVAARTPNHAARLTAMSRAAAESRDACEVRRTYTSALAERLGLQPESFTRPGALARALRRRGVSTDVALDGERFLRELDEAAFSSSGSLASDAAERAANLYRAVDAEALPRTQIALPALSVVALLAIGVATAHAYDAAAAQRAFDRGVAAYQQHNFVAAREAFIGAVAADPGAPDAWADLGTASWAVADTARSVAAWQHALRLEPLATDVRDRVELVHALPWTAAGYVPALPDAWVFDLAALLWCFAWGMAAYRAARRAPVRGGAVAALAVVAALVAIGGFALSDRLSGRHLAVMRRTASLSTDPELGGERGATAIIGEVVHVSGRQGAWSRVTLDDGRDGWLENAALVSLDARDVTEMRGGN
ncbi:MAG: Aerotolerance-related protein BatD [Gemmatimonadetes bacterium]|nr:Aerotolerance-related protein BatD [Gemmatimonadota bacterium]